MDRSLLRPRPTIDPPPMIGRPFGGFDPIQYSRSTRGRRHAAAMLVVALLVVLAFQLFPIQNVTLVTGDTTVQVRSTFGDEREALAAAALDLAPGDRVLVARTGDQAALAVQRAMPVVVHADGARIEVRTRARTVAGALALANVEVGDGDRIYVEGSRAAPGHELDGLAPGAVSAASDGQPLRIQVVRALPEAPVTDSTAAVSPPPEAEVAPVLEAVPARRILSVLVDPNAWRPIESSSPPDMEALFRAVAALPARVLITVNIGGQVDRLRIAADRVEEVLAHLDVELGEHDRISHPLDAAVIADMELVVLFIEKVVEEYIEYTEPTIYWRDDHTLAPGEVRFVEGTPGETRVWEEVTYENGAEISRVAHSALVLSEPISGERLRGPVAEDGVSPVVVDDYDGPYTQRLRVWATWYNATHGWAPFGDPAYGITFTGVPLEHGICAVDPDYIPLGTRFYVPGYGECLAADTGGLINGYDVDLGFPEGHPPEPWHTGYVHIYLLD